uniref:RAB4B, member RAS oncogene family n=1 Tax=Eptatretus burgeri TaxID=7764 RepID=A0A8C4RAV9_EPTBU
MFFLQTALASQIFEDDIPTILFFPQSPYYFYLLCFFFFFFFLDLSLEVTTGVQLERCWCTTSRGCPICPKYCVVIVFFLLSVFYVSLSPMGGGVCVCVCVRARSRETYNALTNWLADARTLASPNIAIILCGNKKDLDADREVTFLEASRFAQENEMMFLETSALTGENVEEAFLKCARTILNKIESGELDPERMGSGIQYGDSTLRQLRQPRGVTAQARPDCNC